MELYSYHSAQNKINDCPTHLALGVGKDALLGRLTVWRLLHQDFCSMKRGETEGTAASYAVWTHFKIF